MRCLWKLRTKRHIPSQSRMFILLDSHVLSFREKTRIKTKLYQEYNNYKEYVPLPKRVKSEESAPSVGNVPAPSAPLSMDLPFQLPFESIFAPPLLHPFSIADENKESNKRNIVNEVLNEINQKEFEEEYSPSWWILIPLATRTRSASSPTSQWRIIKSYLWRERVYVSYCSEHL